MGIEGRWGPMPIPDEPEKNEPPRWFKFLLIVVIGTFLGAFVLPLMIWLTDILWSLALDS